MEPTEDNDDTITKPKIKKERKPITEEHLKKLAEARAIVAANRAAKKKDLEDAKAIVKANKEKATNKPVEEVAPVAPQTPAKKPTKKPVVIQEEESEDEQPIVIIKKKKKQPKIVYESASEDEEQPMEPPTPTTRPTKSQQNKNTKVTVPDKAPQRYYFA